MNVNIQETLDKVLAAMPAGTQEKALSCKSKEEFLGLIKPEMLPGVLGATPIGGFLQSTGILGQAGDFLKDVEWSEIKGYITNFFKKKK